MQRAMVSAVLLALVGCGTPQQQCISGVTRDLQVVDRLITEVQGNLTRGYAMVSVTQTTPRFGLCAVRATAENPDARPVACWVDEAETVSRPAAIDLDAEAAKLASLQRKREKLATAASPAVRACELQYPEALK